jgi:phosphoglycerate dehydrogenase-like enzyme
MKIAFLHTRSEFTRRLLQELKGALREHELLAWEAGSHAPANDIEILLSSGEVGRDLLQDLPKLALVQTTSTGYETVDLDVLKDEPPSLANPLVTLPQALITPHIAAFTDLMLAGTVTYVDGVIRGLAAGRLPASLLNGPAKPRQRFDWNDRKHLDREELLSSYTVTSTN